MIEWLLNLFEDRTFGAKRSPLWREVRRQHLQKHPVCELCGSSEKIEVHHIFPVNIAPEKELDADNLITLCESGKNGIVCHRAFGHLGDYRNFNKYVVEDVEVWSRKLRK